MTLDDNNGHDEFQSFASDVRRDGDAHRRVELYNREEHRPRGVRRSIWDIILVNGENAAHVNAATGFAINLRSIANVRLCQRALDPLTEDKHPLPLCAFFERIAVL
jgi:hypothetical protein